MATIVTSLQLSWIKATTTSWFPLEQVELPEEDIEGIYIIWYEGKVIKIGQGFIRSRIMAQRYNREILSYSYYGLYVTWAQVNQEHLEGVERYLATRLDPITWSPLPDTRPIIVNLPW